jgi:hypothetical protein
MRTDTVVEPARADAQLSETRVESCLPCNGVFASLGEKYTPGVAVGGRTYAFFHFTSIERSKDKTQLCRVSIGKRI